MLLSELIYTIQHPVHGQENSTPFEASAEQIESLIDAVRATYVESALLNKEINLDSVTQSLKLNFTYVKQVANKYRFRSIGNIPRVLNIGSNPAIVNMGDGFTNVSRLNAASQKFTVAQRFYRDVPYYTLQNQTLELHNVPVEWVEFDDDGCGTLLPCIHLTAVFGSPYAVELYNTGGVFTPSVEQREFEYPVPDRLREMIVARVRQMELPITLQQNSIKLNVEQSKKP